MPQSQRATPHLVATSGSPAEEKDSFIQMAERLRASPIPSSELLYNLGLYMPRQALSRVLFIHELYKLIVPVHGSIAEFGVRWGQNLSLFSSLRGIYEPHNYNRKIVGFDTFNGFPSVAAEDGVNPAIRKGAYGVADDWAAMLDEMLVFHERQSPIPHIRKFELVAGDATETLPAYLARQPETIFALVYFDFDLYAPTKACLEAIKPHLTQGSVIAFDELNCATFPGETLAVREVLGLDRVALKRVAYSPLTSYAVIG